MGNIFKMTENRKIHIANQNCFIAPIKHPSRLLGEHIISYVLQGEWTLEIGNELVHAKKDCVFIQPANIKHTGIKLCPPNTNTMFVHFSVLDGDRYVDDIPGAISDDSIYISTLIDASSNAKIKELLISTIEENTKGNSIKASAFLNLLLCELVEDYDTSESEYAFIIKQIINENLNKNLTNRQIADMLNISVRTAEITFSKCFNTSIHQYAITQKINQAKFWLEYFPDTKIIKIALDLGFYDEYHFSRQFKKATGVSPSQYRKHILDTKNVP